MNRFLIKNLLLSVFVVSLFATVGCSNKHGSSLGGGGGGGDGGPIIDNPDPAKQPCDWHATTAADLVDGAAKVVLEGGTETIYNVTATLNTLSNILSLSSAELFTYDGDDVSALSLFMDFDKALINSAFCKNALFYRTKSQVAYVSDEDTSLYLRLPEGKTDDSWEDIQVALPGEEPVQTIVGGANVNFSFDGAMLIIDIPNFILGDLIGTGVIMPPFPAPAPNINGSFKVKIPLAAIQLASPLE